jgi:rhodanese-related sulfurtransferase
VQVQELIEKLKSEEADKILVVDVRSHGYYDPQASRIKGSIRIEPNNLEQELQRIPPDRDIYLYCT